MTNISDFIKAYATNYGITQTEARKHVDCFLKTLCDAIVEDGEVRFSKIGTFKTVDIPEKSGVMAATGKEWHSPAHKALKFKPSVSINNLINGEE